MTKTASRSSVSGSPVDDAPVFAAATPTSRPMPSSAPPPIPERSTPGVGSLSRHGSISSTIDSELTSDKPSLSSVGRRDSQASQSSQMSTVSGTAAQKTPARTQAQSSVTEDAEDTMKNLRKTFAGIFGDM
jgi:synapsin